MTHWMEGDWPDERPEDRDAKRLIKLVRELVAKLPASELDELVGDVEQACDDFAQYFEDNDPRSMGWVGDNGLP